MAKKKVGRPVVLPAEKPAQPSFLQLAQKVFEEDFDLSGNGNPDDYEQDVVEAEPENPHANYRRPIFIRGETTDEIEDVDEDEMYDEEELEDEMEDEDLADDERFYDPDSD